jgi:uncharacterized membrane protein YqhA
MNGHTLLTFFLSLRTIMLIGSAGALVGSLLMFLQGGFFLHEAWHTIMTEGDAVQKQVTVPVLEAVDSFLFGIVLVIFAYGIAIGFVFTLPEGYGERLPVWMKVGGVGQLKATLAEVVIVVLIVIFDYRVDKHANCFPMIPSGEAHNHMLLGDDLTEEALENAITEEGKVMV